MNRKTVSEDRPVLRGAFSPLHARRWPRREELARLVARPFVPPEHRAPHALRTPRTTAEMRARAALLERVARDAARRHFHAIPDGFVGVASLVGRRGRFAFRVEPCARISGRGRGLVVAVDPHGTDVAWAWCDHRGRVQTGTTLEVLGPCWSAP